MRDSTLLYIATLKHLLRAENLMFWCLTQNHLLAYRGIERERLVLAGKLISLRKKS